jgi:hypothetical protein
MDRSFVLMEVLCSNFLLKGLAIQELLKRWHRRWTSFLFLLSTDMQKENWLWDRIQYNF